MNTHTKRAKLPPSPPPHMHTHTNTCIQTHTHTSRLTVLRQTRLMVGEDILGFVQQMVEIWSAGMQPRFLIYTAMPPVAVKWMFSGPLDRGNLRGLEWRLQLLISQPKQYTISQSQLETEVTSMKTAETLHIYRVTESCLRPKPLYMTHTSVSHNLNAPHTVPYTTWTK